MYDVYGVVQNEQGGGGYKQFSSTSIGCANLRVDGDWDSLLMVWCAGVAV